MFCQKCGIENLDSANFCNNCGSPLKSGEGQTLVVIKEGQYLTVKKKETTLSQVFEGALVFGIIGGVIGLFGGIIGAMGGFIVMFIIGIIVCYTGASMYDAFIRK